MAYQSISGSGDSNSAGKLTALRLPDLTGKSVLDVGCNEGYFCNAALAAGAASVVGIDASKSAIALARQHYPRCEFIATDWDSFLAQNKDRFDVILFASALHYAKDQRALLEKLLNILTDDGLLILECGLADGAEDMVTVQRGDGPKQYFTQSSINRFIAKIGGRILFIQPSVDQKGDPIPRYAMHIGRPRRSIIFNTCPPDSGKTSLGAALSQNGVPVVTLDGIAKHLTETQVAGYLANHDNYARLWQVCEEQNLEDGIAEAIVRAIPDKGDPVYVDGYLPEKIAKATIKKLASAGYIVHHVTGAYGNTRSKNDVAATGLNVAGGHYVLTWLNGSVDTVAMPSPSLLLLTGWYDRSINPIRLCVYAKGLSATSGPISIFERKDTAGCCPN